MEPAAHTPGTRLGPPDEHDYSNGSEIVLQEMTTKGSILGFYSNSSWVCGWSSVSGRIKGKFLKHVPCGKPRGKQKDILLILATFEKVKMAEAPAYNIPLKNRHYVTKGNTKQASTFHVPLLHRGTKGLSQ